LWKYCMYSPRHQKNQSYLGFQVSVSTLLLYLKASVRSHSNIISLLITLSTVLYSSVLMMNMDPGTSREDGWNFDVNELLMV
jgi:hypothetical protein